MDEQEFKKLIFLYILKRQGGQFDSYSVIRTITRRFEIMNFSEIIDSAMNDNLIERVKIEHQDGFRITDSGRVLVEKNYDELKERVTSSFPEQKEFVEILFT